MSQDSKPTQLPAAAEVRNFIAALSERDDIPLARFYREYWIEHGHVKRLPFLLHRLAPLLRPADALLDVGSFGEWSLLLWRYLGMKELTACSLEGGYIAYGGGQLKKREEEDKEFELRIEEIDIENQPLPHADASVDVITFFEVLEHLRCDPLFVMKEFNRVLKPNGLLILSTPNVNSFEGFVRMALLQTPHIFSQYFPNRSGIGHCKEYAINEVRQLCDNSGFGIETIETFDYHPPLGVSAATVAEFDDLKSCLKSHGWTEDMGRQTILTIARRHGEVAYRYYEPLYTVTQPAMSDGWLSEKKGA